MTVPHRYNAVPAPAKLNLMLRITGRRPDGYHDLQTVFEFIDFADQLTFSLRQDRRIVRICNDAAIPASEDIIIRAADALRDDAAQQGTDHRDPCSWRWLTEPCGYADHGRRVWFACLAPAYL